jgi:hypothetical protein
VSRIIARFAGSPVHVAVLFGERALEATEGVGVRAIDTVSLLSTGTWDIVPVPFGVPIDALAFAESELGAEYDWLGVVWAWWVGRAAKHGSPERWFCSEFAAACLMKAGITLAISRPAYYTPARLFRTVKPWAV